MPDLSPDIARDMLAWVPMSPPSPSVLAGGSFSPGGAPRFVAASARRPTPLSTRRSPFGFGRGHRSATRARGLFTLVPEYL